MATAAVALPRQPEISYTPDRAQFEARTKQRLNTEPLAQKNLPAGFPRRLHSDLVWEGSNLADQYDWTFTLSPEHIAELAEALAHFKSLKKPLGYIDKSTFPLPTLHCELRNVSRELHHGHGFKVVRGVPVHDHSREDNIILYAGIAAHVAPLRARQDNKYKGQPADVVLNHIKDLSSTKDKASIGAPAYTADKQVFHTDIGDIVALFALSTAAEGGKSRLASTWRVYNELAATRPDLIETLASDWIAESFEDPTKPYVVKPLLFHQPAKHNGTATADTTPERVLLQYARRYFTGFGALPRSPSIPPITEAQAEALDALHFLGERFNVELDFQQGDIQFVNNLAVFHARDGFKDTPEQQRHLIRLWLRDPEYAWETPDVLKSKWSQLYDGVSAETQVFPLEPYVRSAGNGSSRATS